MDALLMTTSHKQNALSAVLYPKSDVWGYIGTCIIVLFCCAIPYLVQGRRSKLPEINPRNTFELSNSPRLRRFMHSSMAVLGKGATHFLNKPYKIFSDWGEMVMLHADYIDMVRSDRRFDFSAATSDDNHSYLPGFEPLIDDINLPKVVTRFLSKALCDKSLVSRGRFSDPKDNDRLLRVQEDTMSIVSRMSSRVFMGEELCRDEEWTRASSTYALRAFQAISILGQQPRWLRYYIHWFMPSCRKVRTSLAEARASLQPHIERRERAKAEAKARGDNSPFDDTIEWFAQLGSTRPAADVQIALSIVAIHTTTDLLSETLLNIAAHAELLDPLRQEIVQVIEAKGFNKTALSELKLMDSVLKETQRLKPIVLAWKRLVLEDVTLPDGLSLKKGDKLGVGLTHMWDENNYKDATKFDPYRFLRMRETPGQNHLAHLVSTSSNHLGFGHGVHACPGRFFASNEVKIALCHMLLKYDWKLADKIRPEPIAYGMVFNTNPDAKLLIRRRKEELNFTTL